jgi:predicted nucleic acid-binding protein
MSVIIDTVIWSLALRRRTPDQNALITAQLQTLIRDNQVILLGAIRQEILSGIRTPEQFNRLSTILRAFPDARLVPDDYELAAEFFNTCRRQGIQGSNTDFLICAVAHRRNYPVFTVDQDFQHFQAHIPVVLYDPHGSD